MNENEEKNVEKVEDLDAFEAGSRSRSASVGYCESASDDFVQDWVEGLLMLPWIRKSSSQRRGVKLGQLLDQPGALDLLRDAFLFTLFVGQGLVQIFQYLHLLHRPCLSSIPAHQNTQNLFSHRRLVSLNTNMKYSEGLTIDDWNVLLPIVPILPALREDLPNPVLVSHLAVPDYLYEG